MGLTEHKIMKVRWNRSSLRLRITPSELLALRQDQSVSEPLAFPGGAIWQVGIAPAAGDTQLSSSGCIVTLHLSHEDRDRLAMPETEGVYFQTDIASNRSLRYYIEKDFPCVHPRASNALEPPTEAFAAPPGFADRKDK